MGAPMALNLHKAGFLSAVWNRTRHKAERVAEQTGVSIAESPGALARGSQVVLLSVSADRDVLAMVKELAESLQPGSIVIDHSTVSADTAQRAAEKVAEKGGHFLDAPVSGGVEGARNGTLAIMIGGDPNIVERVRPVLQAVGQRIVHMGPIGSGQATKAVNQIVCAGINQAVTEALAFGQTRGLPMDKVIDVVGSGACANWFLSHRGPTMVQGCFEPGFKIALHQKDLGICRQMAGELGVQLPVIEMTMVHYQRLLDEGRGDEDISALYRLKKRLFEKG
jgi:3-hydroxyisobutyrate dehydrogenase and related beta-hydroxyacid dehydrogenases